MKPVIHAYVAAALGKTHEFERGRKRATVPFGDALPGHFETDIPADRLSTNRKVGDDIRIERDRRGLGRA
jgi:hypothetical protein